MEHAVISAGKYDLCPVFVVLIELVFSAVAGIEIEPLGSADYNRAGMEYVSELPASFVGSIAVAIVIIRVYAPYIIDEFIPFRIICDTKIGSAYVAIIKFNEFIV